jgi:flagellar basal body-associated protein FliL
MMLNGESEKKSADGHSNSKKGKNMDIIVTVAVAILIAIISVLFPIFTKKTIKKIFIFAILGLIIGLPVGYFLTPIIISFF